VSERGRVEEPPQSPIGADGRGGFSACWRAADDAVLPPLPVVPETTPVAAAEA